MAKKLKMGLLGCGPIAQMSHLKALKKAENIELTAICDVAEDLVRTMATRYEVEWFYTDHYKFLTEADIEAVLIPVADPFHAPLTIDCLQAGKHVLVEKPMAVTVEECEEMVKVSKEMGKQIQIGCMKRYDPGLQFAQKFVKEEMGEKLTVSGWYCDTVFHSQYVSTLWPMPFRYSEAQKKPKKGIEDPHLSLLLTHGVHAVDTLRFFGGDIVAVATTVAKKKQGIASTSLLEFADGACGALQLVATVKMDWYEGLMIHGENGSVLATINFPYYLKGAEVKVFDARVNEYRTPAAPDSDPYERQLEAFAAAILEGRKVSPDAEEGLADQRVLYAMHRSQQSGERVMV